MQKNTQQTPACPLTADTFERLLERPHTIKPATPLAIAGRPRPICPKGCTMNVDNLLRIRDHILANAKNFQMEFWNVEPKTFNYGGHHLDVIRQQKPWLAEPECGTSCCIGGWAEVLFPKGFMGYTAHLLRIIHCNYESVTRLISHTNWPRPFRDAYHNARTPEEAAAAGADAIDDFIRTCGWNVRPV